MYIELTKSSLSSITLSSSNMVIELSPISLGSSSDAVIEISPSSNTVVELYTSGGVAADGDMKKTVYDTDMSGIVDKAESIDDGTHTATAEDIEDAVSKKHSVLVWGTKQVDETNIGNGKTPVYRTASGKYELETPASAGGHFGGIASKTISSGDIELTDSQHFVALTGEGDTTDTLTTIGKSGGELDAGHLVVLKGKASLAYVITISDSTYFHLQADCSINSEYDTIILISQGSGHWLEIARANNA